jgi:hypothetical protein
MEDKEENKEVGTKAEYGHFLKIPLRRGVHGSGSIKDGTIPSLKYEN